MLLFKRELLVLMKRNYYLSFVEKCKETHLKNIFYLLKAIKKINTILCFQNFLTLLT